MIAIRWSRRSLVVSAAGMLLIVGAAAGWAVVYSPIFTVRQVQVTGAAQVSGEQVESAAAIALGTSMARLPVDEIAQRIEALDAVAQVDVVRAWPSTVRIEVVERRPVASIKTDDGYAYVGSDFTQYREVVQRPENLPLLEPASSSGPAAVAPFEVAAALSSSLLAKVSLIRAAPAGDVTLQLRSGAVVDWGSSDLNRRKAQIVRALLKSHPAGAYDVSVPSAPAWSG